MIAQALTPDDRLKAAPFLREIPGVHEDGFWKRVEEGFHAPFLLLSRERLPVGLLVATVLEQDDGRELSVQLATSPGVASEERSGLLWLFKHLARVNNCQRIVFESKRRGWVKVARSLGFAPETIVRCVMEVPRGR